MKEKLRIVRNGGIILIAGALAAYLLLALAYLLPVNQEHEQNAYEVMENEGWYPSVLVLSRSLDTYFHSLLPGVMDGSTDRIMLEKAMDQSEGNVFTKALSMGGYSYYWHGYVSILRPILLLIGFVDLRFLNGILQILLMTALVHTVWRKKGKPYAIMMLTSYVLLMPLALAMSLQFSWVFYLSMGGCLLFIRNQGFFEVAHRFLYFFLIIGMLTSYLDLLTYPLLTWGVPVVWGLVLTEAKRSEIKHIWFVVSSGIGWIIGYAGMWVMKWVLGSIVLKENIFEAAMYEVFFRSGALAEEAFSMADRFEAMYVNWKHYFYIWYAVILILWLAWGISRAIKSGWHASAKLPALFLTGASGIVWYFVLANHTAGHHFFTYRIYNICILAFLAVMLEAVQREAKEERTAVPQTERRRTLCVLAILGAVSVGLPFLAREEIVAINGSLPYTEKRLSGDMTLESEFVPTFDRIVSIGFCFLAERESRVEVTLWQGTEVVDSHVFVVNAKDENAYYTTDTDWKLEAGAVYQIKMAVQDGGSVNVLVTEPEYMPLSEYPRFALGGLAQEGQLISGISYRHFPLSKRFLAFLACTWFGILIAAALTGYSFFERRGK